MHQGGSRVGRTRSWLSPVALGVVIALGHGTGGYRLAPLTRIVGLPRSSVQRALQSLASDDLVEQFGPSPHRYRLAEHPAADALITVALHLSPPEQAMIVAIRASSAIAHVLDAGATRIVVLAPDAHPADIDRLERTLAVLQERGGTPLVRMAALNELAGLAERDS